MTPQNRANSAPYCPFRGCAGDWVKLGVAKCHRAVLWDAICLNSLLPCVLVDGVRCKIGKFSCCVPGCTNNWRNSPYETSRSVYSLLQICWHICSRSADDLQIICRSSADHLQNVCRISVEYLQNVCTTSAAMICKKSANLQMLCRRN